jgi:hypothetical protein
MYNPSYRRAIEPLFSSWFSLLRPTCAVVTLLALPGIAPAVTATVSNTLNLTVNAAGELSAPVSATLTNTGTTFNAYAASVALQYRARTSAAGGGNVTLKVIQDFGTGGPSVAGGDLTYTCGAADLGTACSGSITASTSSSTQVVNLPTSACTGGGGSCSANNPNTITLTFNLADQPIDKTGTFTTMVQFTISAT